MEKSRNYKRISWVVKAALILALVVVAQTLSKLIPTAALPLVSTACNRIMVNLVLIVGAGTVGFSGTAAAAILSPVLAYAMGKMIFPQMIPVISIGNLIIVTVTWALFMLLPKKSGRLHFIPGIIAVIIGACVKCAFLWVATARLIIPLFYSIKSCVKTKSYVFMASGHYCHSRRNIGNINFAGHKSISKESK